MMKLNLFKFSKWVSAWTAIATLVAAPVAMGKEAENITMQMMQQALNESGLNKSITVGQFYEKNKSLLSPRIQKEIEPVVVKFKNQLMPTFELSSSKSTNGLQIPTIRIEQGNESVTTQWFGEENKYVKFGNTQLSKVDLINFDDMIIRILAGDEKYRQQINAVDLKADTSRKSFDFAEYPELSKREWASMSDYDKASHIVNMRSLWLDARKVLIEKNKASKKPTKTSKNFLDLIFGHDVEAKGKVVTEERSSSYFNGDSCIVAGYVARYDKKGGEFCNHEMIHEVYNNVDNSLYVNAKAFCEKKSAGDIACNPSVFGTPNGKPTCVTPSRDRSSSFQYASTWEGKCDSESRLQATKTSFLKQEKTIGRYAVENLKLDDAAREAAARGEQGKDNFRLTENYLLGVLKFRNTVGENVKSLFDDGVLSNTVLDQILIDQRGFKKEIDEAAKSCQAESDASQKSARKHESNYWKACDQLKNRYLFIEALFASKCKQGNLDPKTLKCSCDNPKGPAVAPGAKCSAEVARPTVPPPVPGVGKSPREKVDCGDKKGTPGMDQDCLCASGKGPTVVVTSTTTGQKQYSCTDSGDEAGPAKEEKECTGLFCSSFLKKLLFGGGIILGGVVLYKVIGKLFGVKKPALTNPGDGCPVNGLVVPCRPVCTAPFALQADNTCNGCALCPPGQSATIANGCNCSGSSTTAATTLLTCPDNVTQKSDVSQCPYYACNTTNPATSYQNPANCPTGASTSPANPGTSTSGSSR